MARRATVDKDAILDMLRDGKSTRYIAERLGVTRQAIDLHRKGFIRSGMLPDRRAIRTRKITDRITSTRTETIPLREAALPEHRVIPLDAQIDLMIEAFSALRRLPALQTELEACRRNYENAAQEIERLRQIQQKRVDQEGRWSLAQSGKATNTSTEK